MKSFENKTPIQISNAGLSPTHEALVTDEHGAKRTVFIAGERPLTIYIDKREIVTLMSLGTEPEALILGYLRNQGFFVDLSELSAVQVDWETNSAAVVTIEKDSDWEKKLARRTITSGCGQGTVFGDQMEKIESIKLPQRIIKQSTIYALLDSLKVRNSIYRQAGAVHGCALSENDQIQYFVEDVGRHNAVDTISGKMWLDGISGSDKIFYTTGRLTSEMVIKVAQMGVPTLLSRSGITEMGLSLAKKVGLTLIGRAKGHHFLVFNGADKVEFDSGSALP